MPDFIPPFSTRLTNRQVILARRPAASPIAADFARKDVSIASPDEGQFLVRNLYLAADPVQRGWAANEALTPLGQPMRALAVGVVVESRDDGIRSGDVVYGFFGWQDYKVATRGDLLSHIPQPRAPLSAYAGVLGMPGVTAWLALQDIAPPYEGAAMLVSTAAGTVGSVVGQIGQRAGAFVVGLTGSDEKVESCVRDYGYDVAYNYKSVDLAATLAEARPDGFNIYFDNTGGQILDTAIRAMARHGRIVHCGTAATPSWNPPPTGLRNEREILMRALICGGFVIFDHVARFPEAVEKLSDMVLNGDLKFHDHVEPGIERVSGALEALFADSNAPKTLVYIGED